MVYVAVNIDILNNSVSEEKEAFVVPQGLAGKLFQVFTKCGDYVTPL